MYRPYREDRKRRYSEMEQVYCGPEEFLEAGTRGFLITTQADREEFALDDAIDLLRQASIMLYGGFKPRKKKPDGSKGYVKINFMDPGDVQLLPLPEGEAESEEEEEEDKKDEKEKSEETKDGDDDEKKEKEDGDKGEEVEEEAEGKDDGKDEEEGKEEDTETKEGEEGHGKEPGRYKRSRSKREAESNKEPSTYMKCKHKFKAFRTEIRSLLFIKSNVADPTELASAAMQLVLKRRTVPGDAMITLLPVIGVCEYDLTQLEIMTQRVLRPQFDESLPPKSFNVMIYDKISEPGSDLLAETVRNAIWCMNPSCWMSSPLTEPEALVTVELIGSKLVMCCMTNFMLYRQYSPSLLANLGPGEPEDDDGTDMNDDMKKQHEAHLRRIERRKKDQEEKIRLAEEERQQRAAERRAYDEERRKMKVEEKKKREEERKKREETAIKRREDRKKREEEEKRRRKEEAEKKEEESEREEKTVAEGKQEAEEAVKDEVEEDTEMPSDPEEGKSAAKGSKRGRGRGRGRAKK